MTAAGVGAAELGDLARLALSGDGDARDALAARVDEAAAAWAGMAVTDRAAVLRALAYVDPDSTRTVEILPGQRFQGVTYYLPARFDVSALYAAHLICRGIARHVPESC